MPPSQNKSTGLCLPARRSKASRLRPISKSRVFPQGIDCTGRTAICSPRPYSFESPGIIKQMTAHGATPLFRHASANVGFSPLLPFILLAQHLCAQLSPK
jgi:hypothetical protein